jgi:lysophospholipase L1-like esterase
LVHKWNSLVSLGDSFTEGMVDLGPDGNYVGWADRLAVMLAEGRPDFEYANLAIRGKLIRQIRDDQLPFVLAAQPDIVTLSAGGNDVIAPGTDVDEVISILDAMVAQIRANGADVVLFTGPDTKGTTLMSLMRSKIALYNLELITLANKHGCFLVDLWHMDSLKDRRAWGEDRLHFTAAGHHKIALRAAEILGIATPELANAPWPTAEELDWVHQRQADYNWARIHLLPWIGRHLRGRSSGDGLSAKRPTLAPIGTPQLPNPDLQGVWPLK